MASLYLDRQNLELGVDNGRLWVRAPDGAAQSFPLGSIERVVVAARARIDSRVLTALNAQGSVLTVVSRREPELAATVGMTARPFAMRRVAQYWAYRRPEVRLKAAREILRHKVRQQVGLLRRLADARPELGFELRKSADQGEEAGEALRTGGPESLLGVEGAAAAAYFKAYSMVFAAGLEFRARNRRPPRDPVNVCLSLGYTLLHVEAVRALTLSSLDPYIGFLHELRHGRESLACDLVELERARVDEWVWGAFRDRLMRREHFTRSGEGCLMGRAGRKAFYGGFQPVADQAARRLGHWARAVVRFLARESREGELFAERVSDAELSGETEA